MAISQAFAGSKLLKPGSYSQFQIDNSAGTLSANDTLLLIGESSQGAPGSQTGILSFTSAQLSSMVAMFGKGPLIDCAVAAVNPSKQNGVGGSGTILVYKTNASVAASAALKQSTSSVIAIQALAAGAAGNSYSVAISAGTLSGQKMVQVNKIGGKAEMLGQNPANVVMNVQYTGNGTAASMTIANGVLTTTLTGQSDSSANLTIALGSLTMKGLVDQINAHAGYSASLMTVSLSQTPSAQLDAVAAESILTAQPLMMIQQEIINLINNSARVSASASGAGIPDNQTALLAGGAQGASANSDFAAGMAAALGIDLNAILCCISRDASVDVADAAQGFTDPSSTYTLASVQAAQESHLRLRGSVKNRKEAQGFGGVRLQTKAAALAVVAGTGSELEQVCIQDIYMNDATGNNRWMHPHVTAAFAAGMRTGVSVGEPLTFKYANVINTGHFVNPATGNSAGDFNPAIDFDQAIQAGAMFLEQVSGGFRWVVDCTTYGIDDSFVFNRGSVVEAVQYVNKYLRSRAEQFFVGQKISNGSASSISTAVATWLKELNAPNVNITTASAGAPNGYDPKSLSVVVTGNTAHVSVKYIPVQGLDFVLFSFTIGDISQSA